MEWYEFVKDKFNLDVIIIAIVLLSGFFQERYLPEWKVAKDPRLCAALKTLFVSFIAGSIYIFLIYKQEKGVAEQGAKVLLPWVKYFISYFFATSLYDMVIRPFRKWIKAKTGDTDPEPKP